MSVRCGIDLGTTYSSISWYDPYNNRVDTIQLNSADGAPIIRSVVYYPGSGQPPVIGDTAWNAARNVPDRVIYGIKRSMGTDFKTAPIDGVSYTPQQVSAEMLRTLVKDAEMFLGEKVEEVVITVPAYFGDNERAATEEAGRLAGLKVLGLLPEPHAAALAYAVEKVADINDKHLLVYDLGGGTFDVTLIHATTISEPNQPIRLEIKTLCKDGNAALGGLDWDRALAEIVAEKIQQQFGVDVWQDPKNEAVLLDNCEKRRRDLSRTNTVTIVGDLMNHQVDVSLSEFEDRTRDLLLQTQMLVEKVVEDAGKAPHNIPRDKIDLMLTGGASKMPMVSKMVEPLMGKPPLRYKNPELLVTIGAAYWAHLLQSGGAKPGDPTPVVTVQTPSGPQRVQVATDGLVDQSVYAVGIEILRPDGQGGFAPYNAVVIPSGAGYGQEFMKEFARADDNQKEILIKLYKGESEDLENCTPLMTFEITGLPAVGKKGDPVKVKLGYDSNGIICGEATDVVTSKKIEIKVDRSK